MKLIASLLLMFAAMSAQAVEFVTPAEFEKLPDGERMFCATNNAGGYIILTVQPLNTGPNDFFVFTTSNTGRITKGRWTKERTRTTIFITWDDGNASAFEVTAFQPCRL